MVIVSDAVVLIGDNRLDGITAPAYLQPAYIIGKRLYSRILAGILVGELVYEIESSIIRGMAAML